MKAAPVLRAINAAAEYEQTLVHTGQHYDRLMSGSFFEELGLPEPDVNLAVGAGSHAPQTAAIMTRLEPVLADVRPEMVVVYGDVNSTMAAALTAAKMNIPVAHRPASTRSTGRCPKRSTEL